MNPLPNFFFGNPTYDQMVILKTKSELDYVLPKMFETDCPLDASVHTQDELDVLCEYQKEFSNLDEKTLKKYHVYDTDFCGQIIYYFKARHEIDFKEIIEDIINETNPVLYKVKYKFQRARPGQLAFHFKKSLFPRNSLTANTPSFPSKHAFQGHLITETIGSIYPRFYSELKRIETDVNEQRLSYGLNYPSDIDFAQECAKIILRDKKWTAKYKI